MILAIDIGNTHIVLGGLVDNDLKFSARLASDTEKTEDQYALEIQGILALHKVDPAEIEGGILSSTVPYLQEILPRAFRLLTGKDILIVGPETKTNLHIQMDDPSSIAGDLLVSSAAAAAQYPTPLAVIDMGTATTVILITGDNNYVGGLIISGMATALNALAGNTARLPYIDLAGEVKLQAKNTVEALRSGAVPGYAAMMDGLMQQFSEELGEPVNAVLTGGLSKYILPYVSYPYKVEPDLMIEGLKMLYEMNKK